jgi:hypothetical protein
VEWANILKDGSQELSLVDTVVWSPPRFLTEQMRHEPGKEAVRTRTVWVCDGKKVSRWQNGRKTYTGRANNWGLPANYVFAMEMAAIREAHPFFLNRYTHCDIDDGTRGYSRLWNENGAEARFNTATGLLTEYHFGDGGGWAHTYQEVGGLWFPLEAVNTFTEVDIRNSDLGHQGVRGFRQVFSRVVLNEPLDESLFDLNNPG